MSCILGAGGLTGADVNAKSGGYLGWGEQRTCIGGRGKCGWRAAQSNERQQNRDRESCEKFGAHGWEYKLKIRYLPREVCELSKSREIPGKDFTTESAESTGKRRCSAS